MNKNKLLIGTALVAFGVLTFTDALDDVWRFWPVLLIAVGIINEADALGRRTRDESGFVLIAVGVWLLAGSQRFLGLNYATALPIGIAVFGTGLIVHAMLEGTKENDREHC
jgi:hypothetical protein